MRILFEGTMLANHHQFFLADAKRWIEGPVEVQEEAMKERVVWKDDVLTVLPVRNMAVPVAVELHDEAPVLDLSVADHVVEAGLRSSGRIIIAGYTDYQPAATRLSVPAGHLKARVVFTGLGTVNRRDRVNQDLYTVHLWPGRAEGVDVLTQWAGWHSSNVDED